MFAAWPGARVLRESAMRECLADVEDLVADEPDYGAGWDLPSRAAWEEGHRVLTCSLVRMDYAPWSGASGLVPTSEPPVATAPANVGEEVLDVNTLAVGSCVTLGTSDPDTPPEQRPMFFADCASPHNGETYYVHTLPGAADEPFPGDAALDAAAQAACGSAFGQFIGIPFEESRLSITYFYPGPETWPAGDRLVHCIAFGTDVDEQFVGSLAGLAE